MGCVLMLSGTGRTVAATLTVEPSITRSIKGISDLNRLKYFNLCSTGSWYESKLNKCELPNRYDYYTHDLEMTFGRNLSIVKGEVDWGSSIHEDPANPGTVDIPRMISELNPSNEGASSTFINDYSPDLNVAAHEHAINVYPDFMDKYWASGVDAERWLPSNTVAAADVAVNLLKYRFTDLMRPAFYEIRNEPDWRYWSDPVFRDLHLDIHSKAKQENLATEIGGPCLSVAYYYKNNYQYLDSITNFIDGTGCQLDFYSFHSYDFMGWSGTVGTDGDFVGRVTSGLPLDGVMDAVVNDAVNNHSQEIGLVFSEQGGYISNGDEDTILDTIASYYFPFTGTPGSDAEWDWIMKKRSISNFIMVNSAISNTMAYMNHPHIVKKAVPFILDESAAWDPTYYSSLLVSKWFTGSVSTYSESKLIHFFEYFKDVRGRRIHSYCDDPDLQHQAFVDQNKLILLFNNTSMTATPLNFQITDPDTVNTILLRRLGRNTDFTPYLTETVIGDLTGIQIQPLESIAIFVEYNSTSTAVTDIDEVPYYGDKTEVVISGSTVETFTVNIPEFDQADYGILRIATGRPGGTDHDITVVLNGQSLNIPVEESSGRTDDGNEYGTLKSIKVDGSLLQAVNTVQVSFSDGQGGGVGSVVIRAGLGETDPPTPDPAEWASLPQADGSTRISMTAATGSDVSEPVEYYFEETSGNPGGSDSGWQTSPSYTDSDLDPDTGYTYRVQMRDALGNMTDWSGAASATTLPYLASDGPFLEVGGEVCFEAEHYDGLEARSDTPNTWTEDTVISGAVGSYMWTVDGQFTPNFGVYSDATRLFYEIDFTTLGDYTVYVRRWVDTASRSDTVWAGLDGVGTGAVDNGDDYDQWIWKSLGTVTIASAGTRTLDIVRRQDGYMIDRVVVTQGAVPSGTGPAESGRDINATMVEYAIFAGYWQRTDCSVSNDDCSGADFDQSGAVDLIDLQLFTERWLN